MRGGMEWREILGKNVMEGRHYEGGMGLGKIFGKRSGEGILGKTFP